MISKLGSEVSCRDLEFEERVKKIAKEGIKDGVDPSRSESLYTTEQKLIRKKEKKLVSELPDFSED